MAKKHPIVIANSPINLFLIFFETIRGAAIKVPKKHLLIEENRSYSY